MNNKLNLEETSLEKLANELAINYQTIVIKSELVDKIKEHCLKNEISQRQLAKIVPGLTQDRISKIFNGQIGHMTIDKLITILTVLGYEIQLETKSKNIKYEISLTFTTSTCFLARIGVRCSVFVCWYWLTLLFD